MECPKGERFNSTQPRKLEVSVSSLLSEPMLDIDSATLELSLPEDTGRSIVQHIDSLNSQDWEDAEKCSNFNDLDSITDSIFSNPTFSQQVDKPYSIDENSFQESDIVDYPSDISKDYHLGQLAKSAKTKTLVKQKVVNSIKENIDFNQNSDNSRIPSDLALNNNESSCLHPVSDSCENGLVKVAENNASLSEGSVKPLEAHPEYTENFNNYKVCRVIAPGIKECLILETGEQVKCDKRKKFKEIEENLEKSVSKSENSSAEATSVVTAPLLSPLPPPSQSPSPSSLPLNSSQSPPPPFLSSSPSDISDHSAPTSTKKLESDFPNKSQVSVSSDKENTNVCLSPQQKKKDKNENSPCEFPLQEKQFKSNSGDESIADLSGQDKLNKKIFKITKSHMEDSAVYFGNLKLGRGINKNCPRSFVLGSCLKNKISTETNQASKNEEKSEDKIESIDPTATLDVSTKEEPASPIKPLTIKTSLHSTNFLNLNDSNGLSPTGYYSDPCQIAGTFWSRNLELSPVEIGKSFDELCREKGSQCSMAEIEKKQTEFNTQQNVSSQMTMNSVPEVVMDSNALRPVDSELAPSKSGPVPNFKSLQERQVTWMLHQLEEQHLKSMKQQYEQHQRNIQKIQEDMEAEILNQQASFHEKIKTRKNALIKEAFRQSRTPHMLRPNMNHPNFNSYDADLSETEESEDNLSPGIISQNDQNLFVIPPAQSHQPQAIETNSKLSPDSPRRGSLSPFAHCLHSPVDPGLITDGRTLQGGVYATPFPLSQNTLLVKSPTTFTEICHKPQSLDFELHFPSVLGEDIKSEEVLLQELEQRHNHRMQQQLSSDRNFDQLSDDQITETIGLLSINDSRGNLREKHAKHLSDLRLYYEKEIKELRDALSNAESVSSQSAYKKLVEENLLLTKKCQEKEEELAQQKAHDYNQQIQAYQTQLKTYAQRCTDLEKLLSDFKHQLYQETAHNHRKEARLKELETDLLKQNAAIEEMIKLREKFFEDDKQKQATIQKLVTKYEKLEKEYNITKESLSVAEERYFEANAEILYVKRENARLDFDNKRLMRENENLRQKFGTFKFYRDEESENLNNASVNNFTSKSPRSSQRNLSSQTRQAELDLMREVGGKEMVEAFENQFTSPIMAAERELRKLRSSKKVIGKATNSITEIDLPGGILVDLPLSTKTKAKINQRQLTKDVKSKSNTSTTLHHTGMESLKSSSKNKLPFQPKEVNNFTQYDIRLNEVSNSLAKDQQPAFLHQDKSNNAGSSDKSMESKLGQICSHAQFEDLYSSLTKVQNQLESSPITVSKTQQKFQVTLDTIKKLEDRYDGLQAEKNQLQAALSRIPISGRVDRKARQRKEDLEKKLDAIERELGSVRMSLKRFNVLKTSI